MSAQPIPKPKAPRTPPSRQKKTDMAPAALMKAMGGNGWFNPISNGMLRALRHMARSQSIPRPLITMLAWMEWHTITADNRQPYANNAGVMLYLVDMAADLGIEIRNLRMYWIRGVELKLWRNGDEGAAENADGLYLCAGVPLPDEGETPQAPDSGYVHTRNDKAPISKGDFLKSFKPYIREKLEQLPAESFGRFAARWDQMEAVGNSAHADYLAAVRSVIDQEQDTLLREVGIEKKRLDTTKNKSAEEIAEAIARQARIDEALLPHVQRYIQTLEAYIPTPNPGRYDVKIEPVQPAPNPPRNGHAAGPIPVSGQGHRGRTSGTHEDGPSFLDSVRASESLRRAGGSSGPVKASGRAQSNDGKKSVQLHAGDPDTDVIQTLTHEEKAAAKRVLLWTQALQKLHPKRWTGAILDPENKADQIWAAKTVRLVGLEEVEAFLTWLEQRLVANALGQRVGVGLVLEWAGDFARGALDRERQRQAEADQEKKRLAFVEAAEESQRREDAVFQRVEAAWDALGIGDRVERLRKAEQELRGDPHWQSVYRHNDEERRRQAEIRAKRQLRAEIDKKSGGVR